jgi:hypothetical protein
MPTIRTNYKNIGEYIATFPANVQAILEKIRGMECVTVSTGVTNEAARRLYESVGFRIVNQYIEYVKGH